MILSVLLWPAEASAAFYEDRMRGYSVAYPDEWTVLTPEHLEATGEAISKMQKEAGGRGRDARAVVITESNVHPPELAAHINVSITRGDLNISQASVPRLIAHLENSWSKTGIRAKKFDHGLKKIGSNRGLYIEYRGADPLTGVEKRFWQLITTGREQVYTITCAAPEIEAESFRETCQSALENFKKDTGVEGFLTAIPEFWRSALQGTLITLGAVLILQWWSRRKAAQGTPREAPSLSSLE